MKFSDWTINQLKKLWIFIVANIFAILSLIIALIALNLTRVGIENANMQRIEDIARNDTLFNLHLKTARVVQKQLNILEATLDEKLYSGRPKLLIEGTLIINSIFKEDGKFFSPTIETPFINTGERYAYDCKLNSFAVYDQHRTIRKGSRHNDYFEIEPKQMMSYTMIPNISTEFMDDFYYCYEITFFDKGLNQSFKQVDYFHYHSIRGVLDFYECNDNEKARLRVSINEDLNNNNLPLFDQ